MTADALPYRQAMAAYLPDAGQGDPALPQVVHRALRLSADRLEPVLDQGRVRDLRSVGRRAQHPGVEQDGHRKYSTKTGCSPLVGAHLVLVSDAALRPAWAHPQQDVVPLA